MTWRKTFSVEARVVASCDCSELSDQDPGGRQSDTHVGITQNLEQRRNKIVHNRNQLVLAQVVLDKLADNAHGSMHSIWWALEQANEVVEKIGILIRPVELGDDGNDERGAEADLALRIRQRGEDDGADLRFDLG